MTLKSENRKRREQALEHMKPSSVAVYEALRTYPRMLKVLTTLTEAELVTALKIEKANLRRSTFIERLTMRLNKVRGQNAHAQSKIL